jgi:hypothetical protein
MNEVSNEVEITVSLPVTLVRDAQASGLLAPPMMEAMLREELRNSRVRRLFEAADRLAAVRRRSLTVTEVESEVQAARDARRNIGESST